MNTTLKILKELIQEEIGRNFQSPRITDVMYDWQDADGVEVQINPHPSQGGWYVTISTANHHMPSRFFTDESSAKFWAREQVMKIQRKLMSKQK